MKYRIVPQSDGRFRTEYKYDFFAHWTVLEMYMRAGYFKSDWNSIEEAKQAIENAKENHKRGKEREKEAKRFKKENPPIYV